MLKRISYTLFGTIAILQLAVACSTRKDPAVEPVKSKAEAPAAKKAMVPAAVVPVAPVAKTGIPSSGAPSVSDDLIAASRDGDTEKLSIFTQGGLDANSTDSKGLSVLGAAIQGNKLASIEFLLGRGADISRKILIENGSARKEVTVLELAIANKDIDQVKVLIAAGADVLNGDSTHGSHFFQAINSGSDFEIALIGELFSARANPDMISNVSGQTPLISAIRMLKPNLVKSLLTGGANVQFPNSSGKTPMDIAIEVEKTSSSSPEAKDILEQLSDQGARASDG